MLSRIFALVLIFTFVAFAQTTNGFDWSALGVDVVVVGVIISIVQFFKKFLPIKLPWLPMLLSAVLSAMYAVVVNLNQPVEVVIKMAFAFASAAAWLYELGKSTMKSIKK